MHNRLDLALYSPGDSARRIYRRLALEQAWRVVSLLDRNPHSPTRGSFSRTHWGWRFDDFPYPRLQEGVYTLCRLLELPGEDNPFHQSASLARWIEWALAYWAGRQHPNGSFDEAYPNEQCLAATAFTGFYLGRAFLRRRGQLPPALEDRLYECFYRAGDWLCRNDETHGTLSNHLAAAAAALETMAAICGESRFSQRAAYFRDRILAAQSPEGWLLEYQGCDPGYGTHGLFYLAWYQKQTGCPRTGRALERAAGFYAHCLHPDGTLGGEYASRNTEFYYPAALEMLAPHSPPAAAAARFMRWSPDQRRACGVWAMDVFNLFPMLNNLWFALDHAADLEKPPPLPWQDGPFSRYFEQAGLWVINTEHCYALVGLAKGGTVSLFDKQHLRLAARHGGLQLRLGTKLYTSQDYTPSPRVRWEQEGRAVELEVPWKGLGLPVFSPAKFMAFRLFTLTLGRVPAVSRWVKDLLVKVLIRRVTRPPIRHRRRIRLEGESLVIHDRMETPGQARELTAREQFTALHMGSSLYADQRAPGPSAGEVGLGGGGKLSLTGRLDRQGARWTREGG